MLVIVNIGVVSIVRLLLVRTRCISKSRCHWFHLHRLMLEEAIGVLGLRVLRCFQILGIWACYAEIRW